MPHVPFDGWVKLRQQGLMIVGMMQRLFELRFHVVPRTPRSPFTSCRSIDG